MLSFMRPKRARHFRPLDPDEIMPFHGYRVGDILKRWMDPLPLRHYGVYAGVPDLPLVIHANKAHGVHFAPVEDFAAGRRPEIVDHACSWVDAALRVGQAQSRIGTLYNALRANCEHFATYVWNGKAVSWQVRRIIVATVLLVVLGLVFAVRR